ncbi:MAG: VCBS repeat-containing protein [Candidatus Midichloria sp.]|nr:VCBS repeat-containing protein [Candidatus Midichloria sp.]
MPRHIYTNFGSTTISVLIGNGNGTFKPAIFYSVGNSPHSVAITDIDDNGKQDIVSVQL